MSIRLADTLQLHNKCIFSVQAVFSDRVCEWRRSHVSYAEAAEAS